MRSWRVRARAMVIAGGLALLAGSGGCAFGPKVLEQSHSRYNASVARVYEEQLLENIIRCRYNESPFKLSVSSIAAQYELSGGAEARPFFAAPNPAGSVFKTFTSVLPDVTIGGANRPTITLIPSGGDAVRRFLTPIAPETLVYLGLDLLAGFDSSAALRGAIKRRAERDLSQRPDAAICPRFCTVSASCLLDADRPGPESWIYVVAGSCDRAQPSRQRGRRHARGRRRGGQEQFDLPACGRRKVVGAGP